MPAYATIPTRAASRARLQPEGEALNNRQSLIRSIGSGTLSGLSQIGAVLDLPGSSIRDVLSGENPFDQWAPWNWTSHKNRVTGRQMTTKWGLTRRNRPDKWEWADLGGFAAEVLTDPLTYMTFGASAVGKAGQIAQKAGLWGDLARVARVSGKGGGKRVSKATHSLNDLIYHGATDSSTAASRLTKVKEAAKAMNIDLTDDLMKKAPLGGSFGLALPFSTKARGIVGTGKTAQKIAGGFDVVGHAMRYGDIPGTKFSPGRSIAAVMHRPSEGFGTADIQKLSGEDRMAGEGRRAFARRKVNIEAQIMHDTPVGPHGKHLGDVEYGDQFREHAEAKKGVAGSPETRTMREARHAEEAKAAVEAGREAVEQRVRDIELDDLLDGVDNLAPSDRAAGAAGLGGGSEIGRMVTDALSYPYRDLKAERATRAAERYDEWLGEWAANAPPKTKSKAVHEVSAEYLAHQKLKPGVEANASKMKRDATAEIEKEMLGEYRPDVKKIADQLEEKGYNPKAFIESFTEHAAEAELRRVKVKKEIKGHYDWDLEQWKLGDPVASFRNRYKEWTSLAKKDGDYTHVKDFDAVAGEFLSGEGKGWASDLDDLWYQMGHGKRAPRPKKMDYKDSAEVDLRGAEEAHRATNLAEGVGPPPSVRQLERKGAEDAIALEAELVKNRNPTRLEGEYKTRWGGLEVGQRLITTDRGNVGKLVSMNPNANTGKVHFFNHATGNQKTVEFSLDEIRDFGNFGDIADDVINHIDDLFQQIRINYEELGMPSHMLVDQFAKYFPRHTVTASTVKGKAGQRAINMFDPNEIMREEFVRNIKGGTIGIKRIAQDPMIRETIRQSDAKGVAAIIELNHPGVVPNVKMSNGKNQLREFSEYLASRSDKELDVGIFGNHPLVDLEARLMNAYEALESGERVLRGIGEFKWAERAATMPDNETVALATFLGARNAKTGYGAGFKTVGDVGYELTEATLESIARYQKIDGLDNPLLRADILEDVANMRIPKDIAADVSRFVEGFVAPASTNVFIGFLDSVTNLFKASVTGIWPAFHFRNLISGQYQNWLGGMFGIQDVKSAHTIMTGGVMKGAADIPIIRRRLDEAGSIVNDATATDELRRLAYEHDIVGKHQHQLTGSMTGSGASSPAGADYYENFAGGLKGDRSFSYKQMFKKVAGKTDDTSFWKAWETRGFQGRDVSSFGLAAAGEDLGYLIESANRLSPFINQLKKGIDIDYAARKIKAAQVDYSGRQFSAFERDVLQRAFPFYKFSSRVLPHTIRELMSRPGGRLGITIRGTNQSQNENPLTPSHIQQTANIPWSKTAEGGTRYLVGLGLMHEDPLTFMGSGGPMEILSRLAPQYKLPLEYSTQQSFFQRGSQGGGRRLEDLDPVLGRIMSNITGDTSYVERQPGLGDHILSNSPLARLASTIKTATDPRKDWLGAKSVNLLTGIRFSDVSPAAEDAILREGINARMKELGARHFENFYFSKEQKKAIAGNDQAKMQSIEDLEVMTRMMKRRGRARAAAKRASAQ